MYTCIQKIGEKMKKILILFMLLFAFNFINAQKKYKPTKLKLAFNIDTRFGLVKGNFKKASLKIIDADKGKALLLVDANSIDTGLGMRDNHLRDEDFFHVEKYPKIKFELQELQTVDMQKNQAIGKLTIKDITKKIKFPVIKTVSGNMENYIGSLSINRRDFGLDYNSIINPIEDNALVEFSLSLKVINE